MELAASHKWGHEDHDLVILFYNKRKRKEEKGMFLFKFNVQKATL